ncbi:pentatricopeptide repeat-containing protein At3g26630, chloroplastic [Raphanus sativus]|uniref:Pentatricopeptide repeat-containing protein At3g26630, chloroplastic n=1 Tax=Raphanus sativus TaxID=3726 RepID=A0A6J0NET2_RAPSA|nr:pentatricopeptide repeat-containing protein At3g26630, chloroplastic [Raphanus sativus]
MTAPSPSPPPNLLLSPPHFLPDKASFLLKTCSNFPQLKQIHAKIIRHHLSNDQLLARHLISLSSSFGQTNYASLVFRHLPSPSTFTWNLTIRSLSLNNKPREALLLFLLMLTIHPHLDKFTLPFVIKACLAESSLRFGTQVHGLAVKTGLVSDVFLQNTLMDLYFKSRRPDCGRKVFDEMPGRNIVSWTTMLYGLVSNERLDDAEVVFRRMPTRNVVSWTAMIAAYVKNRRPDEAFQLFRRMQVDDVEPNEFTLVSMLQASTQLGSLSMGRWVHDYAYKNGFSQLDCFLGTALIDMYSKCGSLEDARRVFDVMESRRSLATWNSMITSLGVHGLGEQALSLFEEMEDEEGVEPDAITFVGVLSACANTGNVKDGLRYFIRMIYVYGITPIQEHSSCMIQLLEQALEVNKVDFMDSDPNINTSFEVESTEGVNERLDSWSQHHITFSKWDAD